MHRLEWAYSSYRDFVELDQAPGDPLSFCMENVVTEISG